MILNLKLTVLRTVQKHKTKTLCSHQRLFSFKLIKIFTAKLRNLVPKSRSSATLDSGAINTVTREMWMNTYIESLDDKEIAKIVFQDSTNIYHFDNGKTETATKNVDIAVVVGNKHVTLIINVVKKTYHYC